MTSWITLLSLCLACAALLLSVNGGGFPMTDTTECLNSLEDCAGKPVSKTAYPKCGACDRFIRCRRKAKEILCPSRKPVFDVSGKCRPSEKATCAWESISTMASSTAPTRNHTMPTTTAEATNYAVPSAQTTNYAVPSAQTTNYAVPSAQTTNYAVPTVEATNYAVPTVEATNYAVPTAHPVLPRAEATEV